MHHAPFCCAKLGRSMLMIPAKMANVHTENLMIGSQNHDLLKTPALLFYFQPRARQGAADRCGRASPPSKRTAREQTTRTIARMVLDWMERVRRSLRPFPTRIGAPVDYECCDRRAATKTPRYAARRRLANIGRSNLVFCTAWTPAPSCCCARNNPSQRCAKRSQNSRSFLSWASAASFLHCLA